MVGILMIYVFLLMLLVLILINIRFTRDLLHPSIVFKSIWFISLMVYVFFKDIWGFTITVQTLGVFFIGFICFDIGFLFFSGIKPRVSENGRQISKFFKRTLRKNRLVLLLFLTIMISIILLISMINTVGTTALFSKEFFTTFRSMQYDGSGDANTETHLFNILKALGISIITFYITDANKKKDRKLIYYLIIFLFLFMMIFTTGRMWLFALAIQALVISTAHVKKKGSYFSLKAQLNYFKKILYLGTFFLIFFYVYGKITADKIDSSNAINKIAIYLASPLIAFSESWEQKVASSNYFGEYLLAPLYNIVDKIFLTNIIQPRDRTPFLYGDNGFATNVYTFYDTQIRDFGVIAVPFAMFFIGFLLSLLKYKSEKEMVVGFWTVVYAYFMYALTLSFFNDKFFASSTSTYLTMIIYFVVFKTKIFNKSQYIERTQLVNSHKSRK